MTVILNWFKLFFFWLHISFYQKRCCANVSDIAVTIGECHLTVFYGVATVY